VLGIVPPLVATVFRDSRLARTGAAAASDTAGTDGVVWYAGSAIAARMRRSQRRSSVRINVKPFCNRLHGEVL